MKMTRIVKFSECVEYMIKGPFGSDMKKSLYVPKGDNTYKVYIQGNAIQQDEALGDYYVSEEYFHDKLERFEVHPGDYIITCDGTLGKFIKLSDSIERGVISSSLLLLKLNEEIINDKYFELLWEHTMLATLASQARNACLVHLPSAKAIGDLEVELPEMGEQLEIAEKAFSVKRNIAYREKQQELLDDLIKARFVELFEDGESPLKTVEELCSVIVDCPHTTPKYEGELKNPAIRTSEIKKGYITWDSMRYVSDEEYEERVSRLRPEAGDIVYGREGTFGNAAVLPDGYRFCLGQRVMLLRPDYTKCTSEYLLHAVISDDVYRQAVGKNNASTVAHVNVKDVKQFKIPLPSFTKQNQFADFVKQVDKSKSVVQKSLNETQLLFDSLMQKYFG